MTNNVPALFFLWHFLCISYVVHTLLNFPHLVVLSRSNDFPRCLLCCPMRSHLFLCFSHVFPFLFLRCSIVFLVFSLYDSSVFLVCFLTFSLLSRCVSFAFLSAASVDFVTMTWLFSWWSWHSWMQIRRCFYNTFGETHVTYLLWRPEVRIGLLSAHIAVSLR